jgi:hypothetical protein
MMSIQGDQVVYDYLSRVGDLAHGKLTPVRRAAMVAELRQRIEAEREQTGAQEPDQVRGLLQRLGDPASVVAEELRRSPEHAVRPLDRPGPSTGSAAENGAEATQRIARPAGTGSPAAGGGDPAAADEERPWWRALEEAKAAETPPAPPTPTRSAFQAAAAAGGPAADPVMEPPRPGERASDRLRAMRERAARAAEPSPPTAPAPPGRSEPPRPPGEPQVVVRPASGEPEPPSAGRLTPSSPLAGMVSNLGQGYRRELLAVAVLFLGGVIPSLIVLIVGYVIALSSKVWAQSEKRFAAFAVPAISGITLAVLLWLRATGRIGGDRLDGQALRDQLLNYITTLPRVVGLVAAVYLAWRLSRASKAAALRTGSPPR